MKTAGFWKIKQRSLWIHSGLAILMVLIGWSMALAEVNINIRTDRVLADGQQQAEFIVALDDCRDIRNIEISAAQLQLTLAPAEFTPLAGVPDGCRYSFAAAGDSLEDGQWRFRPQIQLRFNDDSIQTYAEEFYYETTPAELNFSGIQLITSDGRQHILVSAGARDNVDLQYVGMSLTGLKASDLRSAGGVVALARQSAFVDTGGTRKVFWPAARGEYQLSLPLNYELDPDTIAHDGVVLVDLVAVDASGNQRTVSKIVFTGEDVAEDALSLTVRQERIIFTNLLESVALIPMVEFQYRGATDLSGRGQGVSYASSHPDLVSVSEAGLVYPLAETGGQQVAIQVSYPGLDPVNVPVEVNPTRQIVGLQAAGPTDGEPWVLERLNTRFPLPRIIAVFDDQSQSEVSVPSDLAYQLDRQATGILDLDPQQGLLAHAAIPAGNPLYLTVTLSRANIALDIPIAAIDAQPTISLLAPGQVRVGQQLTLGTDPADDVGIAEVRFLMADAVVAVRTAAPYELTMDITGEMANGNFVFKAIAVDTAGQLGESAARSIQVNPKTQVSVPSLTIETPVALARYVEESPIRYQLARDVGTVIDPSGISFVEFFLDGALVGEARFPHFEKRTLPAGLGKTQIHYFEIWRLDSKLGATSTAETSKAFHAVVHTSRGAKAATPSRLIRIFQNTPPAARITAPLSGGSVNVGQSIQLDSEFADDTLAMGLTAELMLNGQPLDQFSYDNDDQRYGSQFEVQKTRHSFQVPISEDLLGTTVRFRLKVSDIHGLQEQSAEVQLAVKGDQPPTIAVTSPANDELFVSGLPIQIRVAAIDDVRVDRVDFYVENRQVGSDSTPPFSLLYQTRTGLNILEPLPLKIHAVAIDSQGQETRSQEVVVTLGRDNQKPVVNIASPPVVETEGAAELARMIEDSEFVLKVTGYDNVAVERLVLRGIQKQATGYVLTGNAADELDGDQFAPQTIPGALQAFSALILVRTPLFVGDADHQIALNRYPVEVDAIDAADNSSTAAITIGVATDQSPQVVTIEGDQPVYHAKDRVVLAVQSRDDRGVARLMVDYYQGDTRRHSATQDIPVPASTIKSSLKLDLQPLDLANTAQIIQARIVAIDDSGQPSDTVAFDINIQPDTTPPLAAIMSPIPGSSLCRGQPATFEWKAADNARLNHITISSDLQEILAQDLTQATASGTFGLTPPQESDALVLQLTATDVFGNQTSEAWQYALVGDSLPVVSIRSPAAGSRLVEGEAFELVAQVSDDRQVIAAEFFIRCSPDRQKVQSFSAAQVAAAQTAGQYLSARLRTPHCPNDATESPVIGVSASDDHGSVEALRDIQIIDDREPPRIVMETPHEPLQVIPGTSIAIKGQADDDFYIDRVTPILIDEAQQERVLTWTAYESANRLETIRRPNPQAFGAVIVGQRVFQDFSGRIVVPKDLLDHAGQRYTLKLEARDDGVNRSRTAGIELSILSDENPPVIRIIDPKEQILERQSAAARITVADNIAITAYRVSIQDYQRTRVLTENLQVEQTSAEIIQALDLAAYVPGDPQNDHFSLVVEATDASGNQSRQMRTIRIIADQPPRLSVAHAQPAPVLMAGSPSFQTIRIEDDYGSPSDPLHYFALYTSLTGLDPDASRQPAGRVYVSPDDPNTPATPYIAMHYPEADGLHGRLLLRGRPYLAAEDQQLTVWPAPDTALPDDDFLRLDFGSQHQVSYHLTVWYEDGCRARSQTEVITDARGIAWSKLVAGDGANPINAAVITPQVTDGNGHPAATWLESIRIDSGALAELTSYWSANQSRSLTPHEWVAVTIRDGNGTALIGAQRAVASDRSSHSHATKIRLPAELAGQRLAILAHGIDRFAAERPPQPLAALAVRTLAADAEPPYLAIKAPLSGTAVVPRQRLQIDIEALDNSSGIAALRLFENQHNLVREIGGRYGRSDYRLFYEIPSDFSGEELRLTVTARDAGGAETSRRLVLPVNANSAPQLAFNRFSANYDSDTHTYRRIIDTSAKVNQGEFWVRVGETFRLDVALSDDAGLSAFTIYRRTRAGDLVEIGAPDAFDTTCPEPAVVATQLGRDIAFAANEPTEYLAVVTDNAGLTARRSFLVHPLANLPPQVEIVAPAPNQQIAAGTFQIVVGVVATDDRPLSDGSIKIYADETQLLLRSQLKVSQDPGLIGGRQNIENGFNRMRQTIHDDFSAALADAYGRSDSPHAVQKAFVMTVPAGFIREGQTVRLTARVTDSSGALGRDAVAFIAQKDGQPPAVAVTRPAAGYGPIEGTHFTLGFRAYDNVKVEQMRVWAAYGARTPAGGYQRPQYGAALCHVKTIEARDFEPITTGNIDTPEYRRKLSILPRSAIAAQLGVAAAADYRFDLWVKVEASDVAGNLRQREISYPVRPDEPPVVDIIAPADGDRVVEGSAVTINVNAFDDVGLDAVRLYTAGGTGQNETPGPRLSSPPYQFQVTIPRYDAQNPDHNRFDVRVEAIDTFGDQAGGAGHRVEERVSLTIVPDQPPSLAIGYPADGDQILEGDFLLVQVNAVDDIGLRQVVLNVAGLITGDRTYTDMVFPYEFLVGVPYGQANTDLVLTASAIEKTDAPGQQARTARTPQATTVKVAADRQAPSIAVLAPQAAATVKEHSALRFEIDVQDNVRVGSVQVTLLADRDDNLGFSPAEAVFSRVLLAPPFEGVLPIQAIADYIDPAAGNPTEMALALQVEATDGAGNAASHLLEFTLVENAPPAIQEIQILDDRGFNLGPTFTEIAAGRQIIVNVVASDAEAGVDAVRLYSAVAPAGTEPAFAFVGQDQAAPFQFHLTVPAGQAGKQLHLKADATDVDGIDSPGGFERVPALTILADQPPEAAIVKPDSAESLIIEGEDIEIQVRAVDDLGPSGIDRVVFHVNGTPALTAYQAWSRETGSAAHANIYRAVLNSPQGSQGFEIYARAYDVMGQVSQTRTVIIGTIDDTVVPKISVLSPVDGDILTAAKPLQAVVAVEDIGLDEQRDVYMQWEYRDPASGAWDLLMAEQKLTVDEAASDPATHYYVYQTEFIVPPRFDPPRPALTRIRTLTRVQTPNHIVGPAITIHEIGLSNDEPRFLLAAEPTGAPSGDHKAAARSVYYTAVDQFRGPAQTGALLAAWATRDPLRLEPGLGNQTLPEFEAAYQPRSALFIAEDIGGSGHIDDDGSHYLYAEVLAAEREVFLGTITELFADDNFVIAAKSGQVPTGAALLPSPFAAAVEGGLNGSPDQLHLDNGSGEVLIFTVQNIPWGSGLPYHLAGRIDMPYADVYGVTRKDDLVLVANGHGGVQVVDVSRIAVPYHVGYIKPNGFVRDVAVYDHYAVIAASHEGLVIADLSDPTLPIVAVRDTLGVANRLFVEGRRVYVADMAGDGRVSQLNIIDIGDPYDPQLERTVTLAPARADRVADGVYDVSVSGGKAYATVHYSDQQDQPAQSVVEIIDLAGLDEPLGDATIPAVIHARAGADDFGARGLVVARGGVNVAGARQGIEHIKLPQLTVLGHSPAAEQTDVPVMLPQITISLSHAIAGDIDAAELAGLVSVHERDARIGEAHTFTVGFGADGADRSRIELIRSGTALKANTPYVATVRQGLHTASGLGMSGDYQFSFYTAAADIADRPQIEAITPVFGSIEGNTRIEVTGQGFGQNPALILGGQRLVVESLQHDGRQDRVVAFTVPNYAGPAALEVVHENGLSDLRLGAFTYVDILQISHVDPPVVSVSRTEDRVDILGYGFHNDLHLKLYKSGSGALVKEWTVDGNDLRLYSSERMIWQAHAFETPYRGFVDLEISDDQGRSHYLPYALFYGQLQVDRQISPMTPLSKADISKYLDPDEPGYKPSAHQLPPGRIVATAADAARGLVYVLGQGVLAAGVSPYYAQDPDYVSHFYAPGWIALIRYDHGDVAKAAAMHALGYGDLPQDLVPVAMALGDRHLYVSAASYHFPYISTPYEDQRLILVFHRQYDEGPTDRAILSALPLNFDQAPTSLAVSDRLLFAASPSDGVAVISLADPANPAVLRILTQGRANGREIRLKPAAVQLVGDHLHVLHQSRQGFVGERFVFDITKPSLPLLAYDNLAAAATLPMGQQPLLAAAGDTGLDFSIYDVSRPEYMRATGKYDARGFALPGAVVDVFAGTTLAGANAQHPSPKHQFQGKRFAYLALFDTARPAAITLVDALRVDLASDRDERLVESLLTDDGLLVAASHQRLSLVDTLTLDLVDTDPPAGTRGVPVDSAIELRFNRAVSLPDSADAADYLATYLDLALVSGPADCPAPEFQLSVDDPAQPRRVTLKPIADLCDQSTYRVVLRGQPQSRRTEGLFDHVIEFKTGLDSQPGPQIEDIRPSAVSVDGGLITVAVKFARNPLFAVAGQPAEIIDATDPVDDILEYTLQVPAVQFAGPATLAVTNDAGSGGRDVVNGALQYAETLHLISLAPQRGSINGGTRVTLSGSGFQPGKGRLQVQFGALAVPADDIAVIDSETLKVKTPAGPLGTVDVSVSLAGGPTATLTEAFEYVQPIQSNIKSAAPQIYDLALDSTGDHLVAAAGEAGVQIYLIDASAWTAGGDQPLDLPDLQNRIDHNGDGIDDRLLVEVPLPGGYAALGVDTYFERGVDQVLVTAARPDDPASAHIFIIGFDPLHIEHSTVIRALPLHADFARGVDAHNDTALVAMAERGLGLVDIHLKTKAYLAGHMPLPDNRAALDVARIDTAAADADRYAVVAGHWDRVQNRLLDAGLDESGGFYVVAHQARQGFRILGSLAISASRVVVQGDTAYLAAGDGGLVVVDIADPYHPTVLSRLSDIGHVYDVSLTGRIAYLALGADGVVAVDLTHPAQPRLAQGMESFGRNPLQVLLADHSAVVGAGRSGNGGPSCR